MSDLGHCKDCCCARAWEALGIQMYTGRSIPEEIERLRDRLTDHERWLRDMCKDYRLEADDFILARRFAINGLIYRLRDERDELRGERNILRIDLANMEMRLRHRDGEIDHWKAAHEAEFNGGELLLQEIERLRAERDRLAGSLAACGVVAREGDGVVLPEYETDSLAAVRKLRAERDELRAVVACYEPR